MIYSAAQWLIKPSVCHSRPIITFYCSFAEDFRLEFETIFLPYSLFITVICWLASQAHIRSVAEHNLQLASDISPSSEGEIDLLCCCSEIQTSQQSCVCVDVLLADYRLVYQMCVICLFWWHSAGGLCRHVGTFTLLNFTVGTCLLTHALSHSCMLLFKALERKCLLDSLLLVLCVGAWKSSTFLSYSPRSVVARMDCWTALR